MLQNDLENGFSFSELSLKRFASGKRFNVKENEKFLNYCLESAKRKLIERANNEQN